jgi:hypothetical protein
MDALKSDPPSLLYILTSAMGVGIFRGALIISSSIFLIVAGYTSQQIAPAMGLLGTLAGYLLGKESSRIDAD